MSSVLKSESLALTATNAPLPAAYASAQLALAECFRIDECKSWSDKAAALASYARQKNDDSLKGLAIRIQARAERRCGELLKQFPPANGSNQNIQEGALPKVTRTSAAKEAGLSEHQRKTALRVATIPEDDFNAAVDGPSPPTVTTLATRGTQSRPEVRVHRESISLAVQGQAREAFHTLARFATWCKGQDPEAITIAFAPDDVVEIQENTRVIDTWLDLFVTNLPSAT